MNLNKPILVWLTLLMTCSVQAAEVQRLQQIDVQGELEQDANAQQQSSDTDELQKNASGETLGDYLAEQPNVDSASYGPAVGRPVVRGMTGYRVKILQNDTEISDLSAMSQDHAVGVMPKASERIELLKGPASLVYGATSGGAVRLVDKTQHQFPKEGLHGNVEATAGSNNAMQNMGGKFTATSEVLTLGVSGLRSKTDDYTDGRGKVVDDSDVLTEQGKVFAGWQYRPSGQVILSYAHLHKDYGIPNDTGVATRINMQRETYGMHLSELSPTQAIDELNFDLSYNDYLHDETEGGRKDGLFGQKTINASVSADYYVNDWLGKLMFSYRDNEMKVCHEHGACDGFTTAYRSGNEANVGASVESYLNTKGLPFSHGHPMPNTDTKTIMLGGSGETTLADWGPAVTFSLGAHLEVRTLEADPSNIQETWVIPDRVNPDFYNTQNDVAGSVSMGLEHPIGQSMRSEINLSYLERLPSVDELYWNGFHHATDSYIFGNRNLDKERSVNLDWDFNWTTSSMDWTVSTYGYYFWGYIYQDPMYDAQGKAEEDPFHLSEVWQTLQTDAIFTGASFRNDWSLTTWQNTPLVLSNQFEALSATRTNGDNLPRTAPYNWLIGLGYEPDSWSAKLTAKHVFEATAVAENEQKTPGYTWVSAYLDWKLKTTYGDTRLWLKGENLLDEYAQNHLSFLKTSAPLMGQQVSAGIRLEF